VGAIAASPHLPNLQHLFLGYNRITDAGARVLAASPLASTLVRLTLWDNPLGPAGEEVLQRTFGERFNNNDVYDLP
jgi:hypothetical protein